MQRDPDRSTVSGMAEREGRTLAPVPGANLTPREREVLDLLAAGKTNAEIAEHLGVAWYTTRNHVSSVLAKIGVETRDEAAAWWRQHRDDRVSAAPFWRRWALAVPWLPRALAAATIAAACIGLGVLGILVATSWSDDDGRRGVTDPESPSPAASSTSTAQASVTVAGSPTPFSTPVIAAPADESDPWALVKWLDDSLRAGDVTPFIVRAQTELLECGEHNTPPIYSEGPCMELGTVLEVVPVSFDTPAIPDGQTQYLQRRELRDHVLELVTGAQPTAQDEFGGGEARMFSYWHGGSYEGVERFAAATTAITDAGRVTETSWWSWNADRSRWELTSLLRTEGPRAALYLDPRLGTFTNSQLIRFDPSGPSAEPTPVVPTTPFSAFVNGAATAVSAANPAFFVERIHPRPILCTEANTPAQGIGAPPCLRVGEDLSVIMWNHGVQGGMVPIASAADSFRLWFQGSLPREQDPYGSGELRVLAFHDGGATASLALTSIRSPEDTGYSEPWRAIMTFQFSFVEGDWRVVAAGTPMFPELDAWLIPGHPDFDDWERWED